MGKKCRLFEIGEKIGAVEIVGRVYDERRKEWGYECRCRCGNEFRGRREHLLRPRQGCRACINKVRADRDLAGAISEEEFNKVLEAKNFEKMQKRVIAERGKDARAEQRAIIRAEREKQIAEKKRLFEGVRLTNQVWIGQKFNRLTVIDICSGSGQTYWVCECDCGNIVTKLAKSVKFGHCGSCGCRYKEV